ncbi:G2/mitotic-specific cyclin-B3 [Clonorchis sinensis]|uniref:G2/mitotic-specific cyclin-B3 n=2 Tax=Clonorchis sinensis TaxID=79923 RepID=A0A8T1MSC7_CLOSI|nr:G2/mitotic-specific cyclin-B3 [Clonorchis sinensis]
MHIFPMDLGGACDAFLNNHACTSLGDRDATSEMFSEKAKDRVCLRARPVLGNITNKLESNTRHCLGYADQKTENKGSTSRLSVDSALGLSIDTSLVRNEGVFANRIGTESHAVPLTASSVRSRVPSSLLSFREGESDYCGSDSENVYLPPNMPSVLHHSSSVCVSHGPVSKRPRCDQSEPQSIISKSQQKKTLIDESEIDRRPFKSKLACDIVRAAFADRVQLEELLAECRRTDFAISALDRSPVDRMMEATDYIVGIMAYEQMREAKTCFHVSDFLAAGKQPNLTPDMLTTLADWLFEVQDLFGFNHETIHLAWGLLYAYFDRGQSLARSEIQLMACAAIMIACKHEESKMPQLTEFLYITDGAYRREEFITAERRLLAAIDFAVHRPNPYVFLRRFARVLDAHSSHVQYMSRFLLAAGMHSHTISLKRESRKAAAVLWLSRVVLRNPSYANWVRRTDVQQLRQLIRSSKAAQLYYEQCTNLDVARSSSLRRPLVCPQSGALDLTTTNTSLGFVSRTLSLTNENAPLPGSMHHWMMECSKRNETSVTLDRTISEPCSAESSSQPCARPRCTSVPHEYQTTVTAYSPSCIADTPLDPSIQRDLEAMKSEEEQRSPFWPPILQHITGYKEMDLIPLAVRYHAIALRLLAEVARGGRLAAEKESTSGGGGKVNSASSTPNPPGETSSMVPGDEDEVDADSANQVQQRCISPGGHYLRRQAVTRYCTDDFLNVADAYPQLAFENFVPHFPSVQCPETCSCFVCLNLVRQT